MLNIFINTWKNYNVNGADLGEWITLPMNEDELQEKLNEVAERMHDNDPEWFVNDYEWTGAYSFRKIEELENYFELNEWVQEIDNLDKWDQKTFAAAYEVFGETDPGEVDNYRLYEDITTDYDLGYYWIEESGCYNLDKLGNLQYYFDYEAFGRDVRFESDGAFSDYGWIERC